MENKTKIVLEHNGDHHQEAIEIDPKTKKVNGGVLYNFSNNAAALLQADSKGKIQGSFLHSGDTHGLQINLKSDGTYGLNFSEKKLGLAFFVDKGNIESKKPTVGLRRKSDHHEVTLGINKKGKLSGTIASKCKNIPFKIKLENGELKSGSLMHEGKHHSFGIDLHQNGKWSASYVHQGEDSKWKLSVKRGSAFLNFQRKF